MIALNNRLYRISRAVKPPFFDAQVRPRAPPRFSGASASLAHDAAPCAPQP